MTEENSRGFDAILSAMRARYESLAGFDSDEASDVGVRLRVLAKELSGIEERLLELRGQVFPQTSTGIYLDRHAACRGLIRKGAAAGGGILRFSRETPSQADLPIPMGTVTATRFTPQLQFVTAEAGVLPAGETSVELAAVAAVPGKGGNVAAGAIRLLVSGLPGVTAVANPAPFSGGADGESDAALRERLLAAYGSISNGTNAAYYHDIAMREPGFASVNVIPRARGRGTVDAVIKCAAGFGAGAVAEKLAAIFAESREINVDVAVKAALPLAADLEIELDCADGYESAAVQERCIGRVRDYIAGLSVGEPLFLASLYKLLLGEDGVRNARILAPARDIFPDAYTALTPGALSVTRMAVTA